MLKLLKLLKLTTFAVLCVFFLGLSLGKETIVVKSDKKVVKTGEIFTYTVKIEGLFSNPSLIMPKFKDFKIISQSHSKNYSFGGGQTKTIINLTYLLFAHKPGVFVITPVILEDGDKKYESKPLTIKVKGKPLEEKKKILPYIQSGIDI